MRFWPVRKVPRGTGIHGAIIYTQARSAFGLFGFQPAVDVRKSSIEHAADPRLCSPGVAVAG